MQSLTKRILFVCVLISLMPLFLSSLFFFNYYYLFITTFAATRTTTTRSGCPKCVIIKKSGKRSCCARGGAWFKQCGSAGNTRAAHTWAEGLQACTQGFASLLSYKAQVVSMLSNQSNQTFVDNHLDPDQNQMIVSSAVIAHDPKTSNSTYYRQMFNLVDFIFIWIIIYIHERVI